MRTASTRILGACLALLLCACEKVEFQSPPSTPLLDCDSILVGDWSVTEADQQKQERSDEQMYLRITENCQRWLTVEVDQNEGEKSAKVEDLQADMRLGFSQSGSRRFVAALELKKDSPEPDQTQDERPEGYVLVAYERVGEVIELSLLNPSKVAHLIIDDEVPGWVEKRDRRPDGSRDLYGKSFRIYVFGSSAEIRDFVDSHAEIIDPPWLRLAPASAELSAQLDEWIGASALGSGTEQVNERQR